mgnify:CR=1 FL=1
MSKITLRELFKEIKIYFFENQELEMALESFFEENNIEKNGLNYHGITYFKDEGIKKLKNILFHWKNIFNLGEDVIELRGMYYINIGKHSYNKYKKKYLIESLKKLVVLCEKAEKENKIIEHWGI